MRRIANFWRNYSAGKDALLLLNDMVERAEKMPGKGIMSFEDAVYKRAKGILGRADFNNNEIRKNEQCARCGVQKRCGHFEMCEECLEGPPY